MSCAFLHLKSRQKKSENKDIAVRSEKWAILLIFGNNWSLPDHWGRLLVGRSFLIKDNFWRFRNKLSEKRLVFYWVDVIQIHVLAGWLLKTFNSGSISTLLWLSFCWWRDFNIDLPWQSWALWLSGLSQHTICISSPQNAEQVSLLVNLGISLQCSGVQNSPNHPARAKQCYVFNVEKWHNFAISQLPSESRRSQVGRLGLFWL